MVTHRLPLAVLALLCLFGTSATLSAQQPEPYDDVMLIINERSSASREIGAFFAQRRNIPERHIYRMSADTSESIDSTRFLQLKWQMQEWMRQNDLVDSISYIVTTKGCPLRVRTQQRDKFDSLGRLMFLGGQASFEDCLAIMNGDDSTLALSIKFSFPINRYYESTTRFKRDPERMPIYLVTRLDAYTVEQVKGYIVRAETPAVLGDGLWVLDVDPGKEGNPGYRVGNDWLRGARDILTARGMDVLFNNDTVYVHDRENVIGYASWGSNDGHSGGRDGARPRNTWINGSLAETFVSTGGRTFNEGTTGGQSLIADWIAEGACGVKGYTDEPYLSAIAHPDILFDRYTSGFNMAESFAAASVFSAWRQVVIGDPKMKLATMLGASSLQLAFGTTARGSSSFDTLRLTNNLSGPLTISSVTVTGANAADFTATIMGPVAPLTIAAGASVKIAVEFRPSDYGDRAAQVVVAHRRSGDSRDNTFIALLRGEVAQPSLIAQSSYDFGAVSIGSSAEHTLRLSSSLPSDTLEVTNYSKSGAGASRFTVVTEPAMPARLTGGAELGLRITYTPSGATRDSATLKVYTLNGGGPVSIKIYGTGATSAAPHESLPAFALMMSPNPTTSRSEVRLTLERAARVRVELLDLLGRTIREVADAAMSVGEQRVSIDLSELAAGAYLCRVEIIDRDGSTRTQVGQIVRQ